MGQATTHTCSTSIIVVKESFKKGEDFSSPNSWNVYMDCSRLSDRGWVGSGYVIAEVLGEGSYMLTGLWAYHLEDYNRVYQAELTTITQAADDLNSWDEALPEGITFLSNSRFSPQALKKLCIPFETLQSCIHALNWLGEKTRVTLW